MRLIELSSVFQGSSFLSFSVLLYRFVCSPTVSFDFASNIVPTFQAALRAER
jgi:hypothetical protein